MLEDAAAVVRGLSFVLVNGVAYGARHKIVRQTIQDAFAIIAAFQACHGELTLTLVDGSILVNGQALDRPVANAGNLAKRLSEIGAHVLTFTPAMAAAELEQLADLLFLTDDRLRAAGGFQGLLRAAGLAHISSDTYTYQRVGLNEAVVAVSDKEQAGLDAELAAAVRALLGAPDAGGANRLSAVTLENEDVLLDLAELAQPEETSALPDAQTRVRQTLRRLRRLCDGLLENSANRTQKGRRSLKRMVQAVERELAERLARDGEDAAAAELAAGIKELNEELAVDGLVAKYLKQRGDLDASEARLLRQIRRAARNPAETEELRARLTEAGLPDASWEALLLRDGRPPPPADAQLDDTLARLRVAVAGSEKEAARAALGDMDQAMRQSLARAQERIVALAAIARKPAEKATDAEYTRRRLLDLMAELGQEMRQPLTVINAVLEMAQSGRLGSVAAEHLPLLEMAMESGQQLDTLIGRMVDVAGMPRTLQPNRELLNPFS
jgi:hypothetical protein